MGLGNSIKKLSKQELIYKILDEQAIRAKKAVKEETYDWEKDDKSSMEKPYGKAPKFNVTDKKGTLGNTEPEAKAIMKGGTTLTGQPRDMVEIDPSMKQRPGQDKGQSTFTSPTGKKSPSL
jgi:hypothetical protein